MNEERGGRFTDNSGSQQLLHIDGPVAIPAPDCHVVTGFDRNPGSHAALAFTVEFAAHTNAGVHVVHGLDPNDLPIDPDSSTYEQELADALESEHREACAMLAPLPGNWTYDCTRDDPMSVLISTAERFDVLMIIIGTPRRGFVSMIERISGESVSAHLIHAGRRPLLMVPTKARSTGWSAS